MMAKILDPFKLTQEDIFWIEKGCAGSWDKAAPNAQIEAAKNGHAWIFKVVDSDRIQGIFVLAVGNREEKELVITCLAGKGMISHFAEVHDYIVKTAKSNGTRRLSGFVARPGLAALYRNRTKAKEVATVFVEELT